MAHPTIADFAGRAQRMARKPKKWIAKATENAHGQFKAKAEKAGMTTREFARKEENAPGKTGKQARLAEALMGMHKRASMRDVYD